MWMKSTPLFCQSSPRTGRPGRRGRTSSSGRRAASRTRRRTAASPPSRRRRSCGGDSGQEAPRSSPPERTSPGRRLERRVARRNRAVADLGCRRLLAHDEVPERPDLLPTGRLGQDPVLPGRRSRHRGDVDVLCVGLRPTRDPIGSSVAVVSANGFCLRPRAIQTRPSAPRSAATACRRSGTRRDSRRARSRTFPGRRRRCRPFTPERLQGAWRRCGRRSRTAVAALAGASAAGENERATEGDEGRSRAITTRV